MFDDPWILTIFVASCVLFVFVVLVAVLYASQKKRNRLYCEEKEAKIRFLEKEHRNDKK